MKDQFKPITLEAEIEIKETTEDLKKSAASVIDFPENKTPDLLFFSGIFLSSGENLNHAFFLPSELIKSSSTIDHKALDMEHDEDQIVGHIYSSKFVDKERNFLDLKEISKKTEEELNDLDMDIVIAGIIYKSRFPEIADEIKNHKWKLSMEAYYQDYDVKIGNVILSRKEAESLGVNSFGMAAKIINSGKEIAAGVVTRVLREILFSGCGLVKNPANPGSIILETAKKKDNPENEEELIINLNENSVDNNDEETADRDALDIRKDTSVGICVSYKKFIYDSDGSTILHTDWCALYDEPCTSFSRDVTDPNCLKRQVEMHAVNHARAKMEEFENIDKKKALLSNLKHVLNKIK